MKKSEKTRLTYEKILNAAIIEFGTKSYETASINSICNDNQIPKGLIYHNFKNKDDLYLCCVQKCFEEITQYLKSAQYENATVEHSIQNLLQVRHTFFMENPHYQNIFFNTVLQPPVHLQKELRDIRSEFDSFYRDCYKSLLSKLKLRDGITPDAAIEYFIVFQEMFNGYFQLKACEAQDFHTFIEDHELNIAKLLDLMLYGIAKDTETKGDI